MRSAPVSSVRLQLLTVMIGVGILMTLAQSESIVMAQPTTFVQLGMALAGIGACLAIGVQMARRRNEP